MVTPLRVLFPLLLATGACVGPLREPAPAMLTRSIRLTGPGGAPEQLTLGVPLRLSAELLERTSDSTYVLRPGALPGAEAVRIITTDGRVRAIHLDFARASAGDSAADALGLSTVPEARAAGFLDMEGSSVTWWEDERTKLLVSGSERYAAGSAHPAGRRHYVLLDRRLSGH
jgi:hypothetical protein